MVSKKEVSAYNLCDLQELQSCTGKISANFSASAICEGAIDFAELRMRSWRRGAEWSAAIAAGRVAGFAIGGLACMRCGA